MTDYFIQAFIYLTAAVVIVPIAKKLGLGSVLGYLIAGVIIGPLTGLVGDETNTIQHFAEFGVVMMLFLVGLELEPQTLWQMKARLLGLGGMQVAACALLIMAVPLVIGLPWQSALAIGLIFSLSSTAIVLQTFGEKGLSRTDGARNAFSVLLFQDIAVIPMLAFIPMLALPDLLAHASHGAEGDHHGGATLVGVLPGWAYALVVLGSIAGLVLAGHYLSRPLFRFIASAGLREVFTAAALLLVVGIAALMSYIGLSPALGTFLAGVVLANSEFKHELESNIEPFKGLLLGLFFITVGAGVNFSVLADNINIILLGTLGVILVKMLVLAALAKAFKLQGSDSWLLALSLAQAGEFGFVLLSFSMQQSVIAPETVQVLQLVVALSMFLTPLLFIIYEKVILPRYQASSNQQQPDDIDESGQVIIAGIGRFGQIVNRLLTANGIKPVVLDHEASQIETMGKIGIKTYYGDATRPGLLHTAGIEEAALFVIAIDNREEAITLTHYIKRTYPQVKVLARAFDRRHKYELRQAGADYIQSETYHSALETGAQALRDLGFHPFEVENKKHTFMQIEQHASEALYLQWLTGTEGQRFNSDYRKLFMSFDQKIVDEMTADRADKHAKGERSWTPPPKGYTDEYEKRNG